jgi:hypothetical protein
MNRENSRYTGIEITPNVIMDLRNIAILLLLFQHYIDLLRFTYQRYREESFRDHRTGLLRVRQFDKEFNKLIYN